MQEKLHEIKCVGCEGGIPVLSENEIAGLMFKLEDWDISKDKKFILKKFMFKNFYETMSFVNAIAWIANQEGHHPDLQVGYDYCLVQWTTHAVSGLTRNDFISAAKIDSFLKN